MAFVHHEMSVVSNEVGYLTTVNTVNGLGQPTQVTDPNSVVTNLGYDGVGRLTSVTVNPGASQAVTSITYDGIGQITRITRPDGSYLDYARDTQWPVDREKCAAGPVGIGRCPRLAIGAVGHSGGRRIDNAHLVEVAGGCIPGVVGGAPRLDDL